MMECKSQIAYFSELFAYYFIVLYADMKMYLEFIRADEGTLFPSGSRVLFFFFF